MEKKDAVALTLFVVWAFLGGNVFSRESAPVIILDAGHGGPDAGAIGVGGLVEKDLTLKLASYLKEAIQKRNAVTVKLTRKADESLSLEKRLETVRMEKADLLISLHFNSAPDLRLEGPQVYFNQGKSKNSLFPISDNIRREMTKLVPRPGRASAVSHAREGDFFLLQNAPCPVLLIEGGYLSSPHEASRLSQDAYLKKLATAIANGISFPFPL